MKQLFFLGLLVIGLFVISINTTNSDVKAIEDIRTIDAPVKANLDTFTVDKFKQLLIDLNVKYPDIVFAQARIESGNFKSKIFKSNHNLFGMKEAVQRPHTALGTKYGHAYYSDWRQSVIDYTIYQSCYLRKCSRSEYIQYLQENYAQDKTYIKKVLAIAKKSKKYFS